MDRFTIIVTYHRERSMHSRMLVQKEHFMEGLSKEFSCADILQSHARYYLSRAIIHTALATNYCLIVDGVPNKLSEAEKIYNVIADQFREDERFRKDR